MLNEKELALMGMAESATAGPWMHLFGDRTVYDRMEDGCRGNAVVRADQPHNAADANNLDFIAAANPASIITLLRELDGARFAAAQRLKTVEQQAAIIAAMSAPIKSAELAELRKLAEAATPGEWTYDENMSPFREAGGEIVGGDGLGHADVYTAYDLPCIVGEQDDDFPPEPRTITEKVALPDARFIAAANPAMILRLLDALEAPAIPAQQQASTDMMPKRAAFIKYCEGRGLDVSVDKDAWGAQIFKHTHIQAMWEGWFNAPTVQQEQAKPTDLQAAPQGFIDYVRANYQGVIDIHSPDWHAKRLWRAAMHNLTASEAQERAVSVPDLPADISDIERITLNTIDSPEFADLIGAHACAPSMDTAWAILRYADKRMHAIMARRFALATAPHGESDKTAGDGA